MVFGMQRLHISIEEASPLATADTRQARSAVKLKPFCMISALHLEVDPISSPAHTVLVIRIC